MFEKIDIQKKINKLADKYKNKKIVLYGAGQFAYDIFQNYDLSRLNIIAITDKKFEKENDSEFFNLKCVKPNELQDMDYDIILISDTEYKTSVDILDGQVLYGTKKAGIEIRPLISLTFRDIFLINTLV